MASLNFLIADTFTDSLAKLTGEEQKAVKTTAFDLQLNPTNPGMQFHKLDKARDKNFWSVRGSADIRIMVHRTADSLLLCYVDHHDRAYAWAERRKLETHPRTGAAQLVEIRETVKEVMVPVYVSTERPTPPKSPLFVDKSDDELLGYGVPSEWLYDVRHADEDSLLVVSERRLRKPPRHCSNWLPAANPGLRNRRRRSRIPSSIPTRSGRLSAEETARLGRQAFL